MRPDLILDRVAAPGLLFHFNTHPCLLEAPDGVNDCSRCSDLNSIVGRNLFPVSDGALCLKQGQIQGRVSRLELDVSAALLGRGVAQKGLIESFGEL